MATQSAKTTQATNRPVILDPGLEIFVVVFVHTFFFGDFTGRTPEMRRFLVLIAALVVCAVVANAYGHQGTCLSGVRVSVGRRCRNRRVWRKQHEVFGACVPIVVWLC